MPLRPTWFPGSFFRRTRLAKPKGVQGSNPYPPNGRIQYLEKGKRKCLNLVFCLGFWQPPSWSMPLIRWPRGRWHNDHRLLLVLNHLWGLGNPEDVWDQTGGCIRHPTRWQGRLLVFCGIPFWNAMALVYETLVWNRNRGIPVIMRWRAWSDDKPTRKRI